MRTRLLNVSAVLFVLGCLLIAYSGAPVSFPAVIGFLVLALALIAGIAGFRRPEDEVVTVALGEDEQRDIRHTRENLGVVPAVRQLRKAHPGLGLVEAKQLVDAL